MISALVSIMFCLITENNLLKCLPQIKSYYINCIIFTWKNPELFFKYLNCRVPVAQSGEDEAPDLQNPAETATVQPSSTEPPPPSSDTTADAAQSSPEHGPSLQEDGQETQASGSNCPPQTGRTEPAAAEAVDATSKAHLFIFDSESQEDDSQSLIGNNTVAPANRQPTVNQDAAFSLTQVQLEEDKQRITELMNKTNQVRMSFCFR